MTSDLGGERLHGFIIVRISFLDGLIPAERDAKNAVVLYATRAEALAECEDLIAEELESALDDDDCEHSDDELPWVESAVRLPDGTLILDAQYLRFSSDKLRNLI